MQFRFIGLAIGTVLVASVAVTGCGKKEEKKAATQVVAKVDAQEISIHQLNSVLAKVPGITQENAPQAKWEVLGKLVEQQLLVGQAVERKLDRKPEVLMAIESAKREILASAYRQELAAAQTKPTSEEIRAYYTEHPELFAQRRVFQLQEISLPKNDEIMPALREKVASSKAMEEVAAWLKGKNVRFGTSGGVRPAEQLPLELVAKVHALKDGQIGVMSNSEGNVIVVRVMASQSAPVDETLATPRIQTFLTNQRASEAIQREIKALKEKARIEYLGEFAGGVPPKPAAQPSSPPPPRPVASPKRIEPAPAKPTGAPATDQKLIEKGLSGLK